MTNGKDKLLSEVLTDGNINQELLSIAAEIGVKIFDDETKLGKNESMGETFIMNIQPNCDLSVETKNDLLKEEIHYTASSDSSYYKTKQQIDLNEKQNIDLEKELKKSPCYKKCSKLTANLNLVDRQPIDWFEDNLWKQKLIKQQIDQALESNSIGISSPSLTQSVNKSLPLENKNHHENNFAELTSKKFNKSLVLPSPFVNWLLPPVNDSQNDMDNTLPNNIDEINQDDYISKYQDQWKLSDRSKNQEFDRTSFTNGLPTGNKRTQVDRIIHNQHFENIHAANIPQNCYTQPEYEQPDLYPVLQSTNSPPGKVRRRKTIFDKSQIEELKKEFKKSQYPNLYVRNKLAIRLNIEISVINKWFRNRRERQKHMNQSLRIVEFNSEEANNSSIQTTPTYSLPVQSEFHHLINSADQTPTNVCELPVPHAYTPPMASICIENRLEHPRLSHVYQMNVFSQYPTYMSPINHQQNHISPLLFQNHYNFHTNALSPNIQHSYPFISDPQILYPQNEYPEVNLNQYVSNNLTLPLSDFQQPHYYYK